MFAEYAKNTAHDTRSASSVSIAFDAANPFKADGLVPHRGFGLHDDGSAGRVWRRKRQSAEVDHESPNAISSRVWPRIPKARSCWFYSLTTRRIYLRLFGGGNASPCVKDAFHDFIIHGRNEGWNLRIW